MTESRRHILVLGDSSMASFGACHDTAIDRFASRAYNVAVDIVNGSFAGMTAADALVHIRRAIRAGRPDAIIVCVGNCDASAYGAPKPFAPRRLDTWWLRRRERAARHHSLYRRNPPGEFVVHETERVALRRAVSPEAHGRYLDAIARACRAAHVSLVVLVPVAKSDFPPCNNIGNVAFYRIANVPGDHARAPASAAGLAAAIDAEVRDDVAAARRAYDDVVRAHPDDELGDIARNNLACLDVAADPRRAGESFESAIRATSPLAPIAIFNRHVTAIIAGRDSDGSLLRQAMDQDAGTYRITQPYRTSALAALRAHAGAGVTVIDAAQILDNEDFVDYGHPTAHGHGLLFHELATAVESQLGLRPGATACSVRAASMNPDVHTGASSSVFEHFHLVQDANPEFVSAVLSAPGNEPRAGDVRRARAVARIRLHPLFGDSDVLRACSPSASTDQGALTELFFLRHMRAVYERAPVTDDEAAARDTLSSICPHPSRLDRWWALTGVPFAPPEPLLGAIDPERLLARCKSRFNGIIDAGPVAPHRYRSISQWFLRESLVFGSPSDVTIYLDRLAALDVLDGCLAGLHAVTPGQPAARGFEDLLGRLAKLVQLHAAHVGPYAGQLFLMGGRRLAEYRRACDDLRDR